MKEIWENLQRIVDGIPFFYMRNHIDWKRKNGQWILLEEHGKDCECSYCGLSGVEKPNIHTGFNSPKDTGRGSWRILCWSGPRHRWYLRWTLPNKKFFN